MKPTTLAELTAHIQVANCMLHNPAIDHISFYCGRGRGKNGMINATLGNPFEMTKHGNRTEVCDAYKNLLNGEHYNIKGMPFGTEFLKRTQQSHLDFISDIVKQMLAEPDKPVLLFCWCAPNRCHAEEIKKTIIKTLTQKWELE